MLAIAAKLTMEYGLTIGSLPCDFIWMIKYEHTKIGVQSGATIKAITDRRVRFNAIPSDIDQQRHSPDSSGFAAGIAG